MLLLIFWSVLWLASCWKIEIYGKMHELVGDVT